MQNAKVRLSTADHTFNIIVNIFMVVILIAIILPLWSTITLSFRPVDFIGSNLDGMFLPPWDWSTAAYESLLGNDGFLMAFIPLMFFIKIPFAVPLILGLCAGAASAVPAACGVFIWFLIKYFHNNAADMGTVLSLDNLTGNITGVLTGTLADRYMLLMIVAFALAIVTVSIIKGLSINHAWTVAVVSGAAVLLIVAVGGSVYLGISDNLLSDILGIVISTAAAFIYECMFFAVDYRGTEHVSFEDDDYYYYVKAVPKLKYSEDEERME